jgi:RNA polymerase sigma-70 factor, ECF subfamily
MTAPHRIPAAQSSTQRPRLELASPPSDDRAARAEREAVALLRHAGRSPDRPLSAAEADALALLYRRYAGALRRATRPLTSGAADAEDVVHDVFVRLPAALLKYQHGNLGGWLRRVAVRTALMRARGTARRREEALDPDRVFDDRSAPDIGSGGVDHAPRVHSALARLSLPLRQVMVLRACLDYSHREIAELLGITPNTSEVRLCRAVKQLRHLLRARA